METYTAFYSDLDLRFLFLGDDGDVSGGADESEEEGDDENEVEGAVAAKSEKPRKKKKAHGKCSIHFSTLYCTWKQFSE